MGSKIFIGNLDFNTTKDELQSLFSQVGPIRDAFLPTDRTTGRPRGFAFVEYESEGDAQRAIERFNGHELSGRALRVNIAEERRPGGGGPRIPFEPDFGGGFGGNRFGPPSKSKGSRRNLRARKRSI